MTEEKRQLEIEYSSHVETKKLRRNDDEKKSITSIETLSNEVFLDIFEYLDGCDILTIFSNLNSRFQYLLDSSALLFKIKLYSQPKSFDEDYYADKIIPNQYRIIALKLINLVPDDFLYRVIPMKSTFSRLEALHLYRPPADILESILISLYALPCLCALTVYSFDAFRDYTDIFSLIFGLPWLKYCDVLLYSHIKISLPVFSNVQASPIQHLIIHERFTIEELINIISYTPQLNRLVWKQLFNMEEYITKDLLMTFSNLTHLSIGSCYMSFNNFERFISTISSQLQVLRLSKVKDLNYLNADRWERLITNYIPRLRTFDFQYYQSIDGNLTVSPSHTSINRFNSSFWIQRQWLMEIKIDEYERFEGLLIYSIGHAKKKWYAFSDYMISDDIVSNKQDLTSETMQLTLMDLSFVSCINLFMDLICPVLITTHITRLVIGDYKISIEMLVEIINRLPSLNSLVVWCSSSLGTVVCTEKPHTIRARVNDNKIRKVFLEKLVKLNIIDYLINLCPCMNYLEIIDITNIDLQSFLKFLVKKHRKNIRHPFILCLKNYQIKDEIIKKLQTIITTGKQNDNCTITCIHKNLYFKFNI